MQRFSKKVVVITGAGSGIGEFTAKRFAAEGASVVLVGRTEEKLQKTLGALEGGDHLVRPTDMSKAEEVEQLAADVLAKYGRVDVVVNDAGVAAQGKVHEGTYEDWEKAIKIDLYGVFHSCRYFMPALIKSQGNIVNVSSVSGIGGDWGMSFYNAAKGGVTNFTRSLAMDHGADNVRVNAVCPGLIITPMAEDIKENEPLLEEFRKRTPLGRPGEPEEVAAVIAFLASDDARYITGVNLPVDGGITASNGQPKQA